MEEPRDLPIAHPMHRKKWAARIVGGFCVIAILVLIIFLWRRAGTASGGEIIIDPEAHYQVSRVVDGDTIRAKIGSREITIRLLGINTPETVDPRKQPECYGHEASEETKALLSGRTVKLAFNPDREHLDKYGRYLLYAYRDDGLFVNEFLVKEGYAREYTYGTPYSYQKIFRADQLNAKAAKKGLWGACDMKSGAPTVGL